MTTITGTSDGDSLYDTASGDTIYGLDGYDYLHGTYGSDTIYGGTGNDYISGTDNCFLYGDDDDDTLNVSYGGGNYFYGGNGEDHINDQWNTSSSYIYGGAGNDTIELGLEHMAMRFTVVTEMTSSLATPAPTRVTLSMAETETITSMRAALALSMATLV